MLIEDIDIYGRDRSDGTALSYLGVDAIKNALSIWLGSKKGDYLFNPFEGGALDKALFKTMRPEMLDTLKFELLNALTTGFTSLLQVESINLIPDYDHRMLEINIYYSIPSEGAYDNISVFINSNYNVVNFEYESVAFSGDNLFQFFTIKKTTQPDSRLMIDYDMNLWKWGKYTFPNLTPNDPRFEDILILANGS